MMASPGMMQVGYLIVNFFYFGEEKTSDIFHKKVETKL